MGYRRGILVAHPKEGAGMPGKRKRDFGNIRQLPGGRFQARYRGPDGFSYTARTDDGRPMTFTTRRKASDWLNRVHADIQSSRWERPGAKAATITVRAYATAWLAERGVAATTREHYAQLLRDHVYPTFGDDPVTDLTPARVRTWHAALARTTGPTSRAHTYGLLRTIMGTAVSDELIAANPARIRGGGRAQTVKKMRPATLDELAVIVAATPERFRLMVSLAVWCSLRFGELAGLRRSDVDIKTLRRSDVDVKNGVLRVRRGVVRSSIGPVVKEPKTPAGIRDVTIPPHLLDDVEAHLRDYAQPGREGLLFPAAHGGYLSPSSAYRWWYPAREAAGRPDLRFHDLRHTGQTYAALTGANLRELMARAGQSSPGAALRYLHVVDGRQHEIAERLASFAATSNVVPIEAADKGGRGKRAARK
jgi:integrase